MTTEAAVQNTKRSNLIKLAALALVLVGLFLLSRCLPIGEWLQGFNSWVGDLGVAGVALFAVIYALATVLMLPGAIVSLGAGFAFGLGGGLAPPGRQILPAPASMSRSQCVGQNG